MKWTIGVAASAATFAALALAGTGTARAQIITNGGFESGFTGWNRLDQIGSEGTFALQSGTLSPVNGATVPAPPEGLRAAMTDAGGPGAHVLYQDFIVPNNAFYGTVTFSLFIDSEDAFFSPNTLDFATTALNQQARVDLTTAGANAFSVASGDVLQNLFQTRPGDAPRSGYTSFTIDISTLLRARQGQTLRLRFAETDNVAPLRFGVDRVGINAAVPEPSTLALAATTTGLLGLIGGVRRRRSV